MKLPLIEPLEARIAPATLSIFTPAPTPEGNDPQTTHDLDFRVALASAMTTTVTVDFVTQDGTATVAGNDYVATSGTITFLPGETEKMVHVPVRGDTVFENAESFTVRLSNVTGEALIFPLRQTATGTIANDDAGPTPAVSIAGVSFNEDDAGFGTAIFRVTLSNESISTITVQAATIGGSATSGADFTATTQLLSFAPGVTSQDFSVTILDDTFYEGSELFRAQLSNPTNATIGTAEATGTILDNELQPTISFDAASATVSVSEGNAGTKAATFTVRLSGTTQLPVTFLATAASDTATSGTDFTPFSQTVTIPAGATTTTFSVAVTGDTSREANEDFSVNLSSPSANAALGTAVAAVGRILNDDVDSGLSVSDVTVIEGGVNGVTNAIFTVTLANGPTAGNVTVKVGTEGGTTSGRATAGSDYTELLASANTLTFQPGETTKQVVVAIRGDTLPEQTETFSLKLSEASPGATIVAGTGTGTILDDDGAAFTINDVTVTEGDAGTSNATFLVRLLNAASSTVTVDVTAQAGTASGSDFTFAPSTQKLTFAQGTLQQLVTVPIVGDLIAEETETFSLVLSNATGVATILKSTGVGTILDNNDPLPRVSIGNGTLVEGNAGTSVLQFTAILSQPSTGTVTALYSTRDLATAAHPATAGVDYSAVSNGTVTFAPGATTATINVPILGDTADEFDETFGVTLSAPSGANLGTADGVGTIQNDEVTVSIGDVSILEGNSGTNTYFFRVSLNTPGGGPLQNSVSVNVVTADGTAISTGVNKDFTAKNETLLFPAGGPLFRDVEITVAADTRLENDEQFLVKLSSSVNALIVDDQGTGTIRNDDAVQISIADRTFNEGDASAVTFLVVSLDAPSDLPVTLKVNTVNGTALASVSSGTPPVVTAANDFTGIVDQTITFAPGELTKNVPVVVQNDVVDELRAETFTVQLSAPSNGATLRDGTATATILDDADLVTLRVSDATVIEGDAGTKTVDFTVSLSGVSRQVVTFDYATADSTATAGQDYVAATGSGSIPIGQTTAHVLVTVNGDAVSEVNERFLLSLLNSPNAKISTTAGVARGTIVDDEAGGARVRLVPANGVDFNEADRVVEFDVVRSGDLSRAVTVQYETVDDTAQSFGEALDFVTKAGTVSFAAGSTVASEKIRVRILGDSNFENEELFQVRLFNPVNAAVLDEVGTVGVESNTDITILEDTSDVLPTLSVADLRVTEGNAGTKTMEFIVKLSASNEKQTVTVTAENLAGLVPANSDASTASLLQDYLSPGRTTFTFDPGDIEKKYVITVNGDVRDEADEETFRVILSGATNAVISRAEAIGTIVDDDAAPTLTLSPTTVSVTEGDSVPTAATFTVNLSEISELPVSVEVTTLSATAVSGGARPDFGGLDHFVAAYAPGSGKTLTFTVLVNGDTANEVSETFGVTLSNAQFGRLLGSTATGTIADNDPLPVVSVSGASVVEGNAGKSELVFTLALSEVSGQTVDVNFATQDGTATALGGLADYAAKTGSVRFAPGELQKEVRVLVNGDTFRESEETLTLQISGAVNGTILTNTGTGRILTDGDTALGIAVRPAFGVEGNTAASTISFTVELSDALTTATTFGAVSTSGTGVRGSDFVALGTTVFTIAPNTKTATVPVTVNADTVFEPTETLFVGLRNVVNAGGEAIAIVGGPARGTIFNDDLLRLDSQTVQFIDVDGDLATVRISKGVLSSSRLSFGTVNEVGGRQLQAINLTGENTQFQDADVTVTARAQVGFNGSATGVKGDGLVNVGAIFAAVAQPNILQFVGGIDLGSVTVGGDLGKIHVGDTGVTSALKNLVARSMGRFGTSTQGTASGLDTISLVLGPIDNLHVRADFQGTLQVVGSQFGIIRNLQIDGALLGGAAANSGEIFLTGRIGTAVIGRIVGGAGANSGLLVGSSSLDSQILNLRVLADVRGGAGANSGVISAQVLGTVRVGTLLGGAGEGSGDVLGTTVEAVVVARSVLGGDGRNSGQISGASVLGAVRILGEVRGGNGEASGVISSDGGRAGNISVHGAIFGGAGSGSGGIDVLEAINYVQTGALVGGEGANSGRIHAGGNLNSLSIFGNVNGGEGAGSGGVEVGGRLLTGFISGGIAGGSSTATTSLIKSGYVFAHRINDLTVRGSVDAGSSGGAFLGSSGEIRSETTIGVLKIGGSLTGSDAVPAKIVATGDTSAAAIQTLIIGGSARFAEILTGYSGVESAANPRGTGSNADARIGTISIAGNLQNTSIVAGVAAGADGVFGSTDDFPIGGTGTTNSARTVSQIARIIIGGSVLAGTSSTGIEAQFVQSVAVRGTPFSLNAGAGNDGAPGTELVGGSKTRVFEVPVV